MLGYCGTVSFGTYDFAIYLKQFGTLVYIIALVSMTFAILSSLDTNLYFPSALFSFMTNIPRKGGVVICGILGIIVAIFELFAHYGSFLVVMGAFLPPLAGPIIAEYFLLAKGRWDPKLLHKMPNVNWSSILAYLSGIAWNFITPITFIPKELQTLVVAIIMSLVLSAIFKAAKNPQGYLSKKHLEVEPILPQEDDSNYGDYDANFIHYDSTK